MAACRNIAVAFAALFVAVLLSAVAVMPCWAAPSDQQAGAEAATALEGTTPLGDAAPLDLGEENVVNPQQLPDSSFIYDVTIADLAGADTYLGGQTVQVVGEVVGDCINAELEVGYCWIVLADSAARTVSVHMPQESALAIDTYGRYGQTGTQLQVRGEFHLACRDHQGQTDIHATHVNAVKEGEVHKDAFDVADFFPGLGVLGVGLLMLLVYWRLRERLR